MSPTSHGPPAPSPHDVADEALLRRIVEEDQRALSTLYERWSPILMGIGLRFSQSRGEVEDILHDVFLEIWRTAKDFDPERGSARTWIVMKMRCRMLDHVRKIKRHRDLRPQVKTHTAPIEPPTSPDEHYAKTQLHTQIMELPERLRTVLLLTYFEHLPAHEVAERMDIPTGTVKSRLASAKRALRTLLDQAEHTETGALT